MQRVRLRRTEMNLRDCQLLPPRSTSAGQSDRGRFSVPDESASHCDRPIPFMTFFPSIAAVLINRRAETNRDDQKLHRSGMNRVMRRRPTEISCCAYIDLGVYVRGN